MKYGTVWDMVHYADVAVCVCVCAVSYTHLDVYKRQILYKCTISRCDEIIKLLGQAYPPYYMPKICRSHDLVTKLACFPDFPHHWVTWEV